MHKLDKLFLRIAKMSRWKMLKAALDGDPDERRIARLCLIMDYSGQRRESNGQFGTGKKNGGNNSSKGVEKSSKRGTMKSTKRKIPVDSDGRQYSKPRGRNISPKEANKVVHEINTLYHAKFEGHTTGIITTYSPDDDQAYDYRFECHGFSEYNIYSKRRNRK